MCVGGRAPIIQRILERKAFSEFIFSTADKDLPPPIAVTIKSTHPPVDPSIDRSHLSFGRRQSLAQCKNKCPRSAAINVLFSRFLVEQSTT
jgi:hypothetical protein